MNLLNEINNLVANMKFLDNKKQQTNFKIQLVKDYVNSWAIISSHRPKIKHINFIDCMCNAGIYKDGDLGTSMEVLIIFCELAKDNIDKTYNLFLNDISTDRIEIIKNVANYINNMGFPNIHIYYSNIDVNEYLQKLCITNPSYFKYSSSTILFADPYDLRTIKIANLNKFVNMYYCELIYNYFKSDFVRNGLDKKISECLNIEEIENEEKLKEYILSELKINKMKFIFSYNFRNIKNVDIYTIIFLTPSKRGIEVLKDSLWNVFKGSPYHRNNNIGQQLSLLTDQDEIQINVEMYSKEAQTMLIIEFPNKKVTYEEIELFLIQKTMIKESQVIKYVLKPLMEKGIIIKTNNMGKGNYKKDSYFIKGANEC